MRDLSVLCSLHMQPNCAASPTCRAACVAGRDATSNPDGRACLSLPRARPWMGTPFRNCDYQMRQGWLQPDQSTGQSVPPSLRQNSFAISMDSRIVRACAAAARVSPPVNAAHWFLNVYHALHFSPPCFLQSATAPFLAFRLLGKSVTTVTM